MPDEQMAALERLVGLNEELVQVGQESNQLVLVQEALANLMTLNAEIVRRQADAEQQLTVAEQQLETSKTALDAALKQLEDLDLQISILNDLLAWQQDQVEALNNVLEAQQKQVDQLEDLKAIQQAELERIATSTYWDEQIATIQTIALNELYNIEKWLQAIQGGTSWEDQILAIEQATLGQLQAMQRDLQALYLAAATQTNLTSAGLNSQQALLNTLNLIAAYNLKLPIPMTVTNFYDAPQAAQRGGWIHLAHGGRVPIMAEPGERIFTPPVPSWVPALNAAMPRFGGGGFVVPGFGSGDTVPLRVPGGSFVLNRTASQAVGFQSGGRVMSSAGGDEPVTLNTYITVNATLTQPMDMRKLAQEIRRQQDQTVTDTWNRFRSGGGR
jgi:hypothetical protein